MPLDPDLDPALDPEGRVNDFGEQIVHARNRIYSHHELLGIVVLKTARGDADRNDLRMTAAVE